jgi:hypothetical protein
MEREGKNTLMKKNTCSAHAPLSGQQQQQQQPGRRLKILALHSFRTSASIFEKQMRLSGMYQLLSEDLKAEITYINAPNAASGPIPADVLAAFGDSSVQEYFEWWNANQDEANGTWHYSRCDESLEYIQRVWKEAGGFDAIIGFSQGAAMAALVAALQQSGTFLAHEPPLKFIICIAGIKVRDERFSGSYLRVCDVPSVHIIGQQDPIKRLTNQLIRCFNSPTVLTHERGHVVPRMHHDMKVTLINFIAAKAGGLIGPDCSL